MKRRIAFLFVLLSVAPLLARAQGGCVNSPESPTAVLAIVGSLSAGVAALRRRGGR